jgi:hypothetical protein
MGVDQAYPSQTLSPVSEHIATKREKGERHFARAH